MIAEWIAQGAPRGEMPIDEERGGESMSGEEVITPTWDQSIFQLFEIYCNTCHADPPTGGAPFPLKTYEQALPHLSRFIERVVEEKDMPPGGITDEEHLERIRLWVEAGGPQ